MAHAFGDAFGHQDPMYLAALRNRERIWRELNRHIADQHKLGASPDVLNALRHEALEILHHYDKELERLTTRMSVNPVAFGVPRAPKNLFADQLLAFQDDLITKIQKDLALRHTLSAPPPTSPFKPLSAPATAGKSTHSMPTTFQQLLRTVGSLADIEEAKKLEEPLPRRTTTTPFVGYRCWMAKERRYFEVELPKIATIVDQPLPMPVPYEEKSGWRLQSVVRNDIWEGPVRRADGPPADRKPPIHDGWHPKHHGYHGIYAFRRWGRALDEATNTLDLQAVIGILGAVELTGKVVVHEYGFRAETATIRKLYVPEEAVREMFEDLTDGGLFYALRDDLSARYKCDVFTDLVKFLEA